DLYKNSVNELIRKRGETPLTKEQYIQRVALNNEAARLEIKMTAEEIFETFNCGEDLEYYEIAVLINTYDIDGAIKLIQDCFNCDETTAKEAIDLYKNSVNELIRKRGGTPLTKEQYMQRVALNNEAARLESLAEQNKPKCPTCGSTNIKSLSGLNRGASIAMFGIFSKKINKSFECKNCGYTW
ncbi:MAG: hypothetical protein NC086_09270, partial [Alistipes sp.]|nr:hypothetical protein [Alistipes sp.]